MVVDRRRTLFSAAAADELAASDDAAAGDAASDDADALEADALADALDALPDPLEHATMNRANIAANTVASRTLNAIDFFIVSLPS